MNKNIKIAAGLSLVFIFAFISVVSIVSYINKNSRRDYDEPEFQIVSEKSGDVETGAYSAIPKTSPAYDVKYYVVRDVDGYLGIFSPDDPEKPELVTEIRTGTLRKADMEQVKAGITVRGFENLARLLEDFGS